MRLVEQNLKQLEQEVQKLNQGLKEERAQNKVLAEENERLRSEL